MKNEQFFELLGDADDTFLAESAHPPKRGRELYLKIAAIAACFSLALTLLLNVLMYAGMSSGDKMSSSVYPKDEGAADYNGAWGDVGGNTGANSKPGSVNGSFELKIIRTATLEAETKGYDAAIKSLQEAIAEAGGYVSDSSERNQSGSTRYLTMVIRIPAEKLDSFLAGLGGDLLLTQKTVSSDDVTLAYYDLESRIATLRAERTALTAMMEKASSTSEILTVQKQLYDVIEEIESLETQMRIYSDKVAFATVKMTLREVSIYTPKEEATFSEEVALTFSESWERFGNFWASLCIGLISALPVMLVILVPLSGVLVFFIYRRKKRLAQQSKAAEKL
jgi:hypothetical protein